tara:strand:- start:4412 stop:4963 length:552 start_codon:yes stop_codon:yes gene_type:complete
MNLSLSFFILSVIILWMFIRVKGQWLPKAIAISLVLYFFASIDNSMDSFSGWPTKDAVPDKFQIHWVIIDEPNRANNDPGKIYLWATDIGEHKEDQDLYGCSGLFLNFKKKYHGEPRVYEIEYSEEMHENLQDAMPNLKKGIPLLAGKPKNTDSDTGSNGSSELTDSDEFILYSLPEVFMQPK